MDSRLLFTWLLLMGALGATVASEKHASVKSKYGQLVTSSTLRWRGTTQSRTRSGPIPKEAVPSGTGNPSRVVCRAEHHGATLTGHTVAGGACAVGFTKKMFKKHKYEILLNTDLAAKLEWRRYQRFQAVPEGAVAGVDSSTSGDSSFIGRYLSQDSGKFLPGSILVPSASYSFGPMTVFDGDSGGLVSEVSEGDVLVEVEPERYRLEIEEGASLASSKAEVTGSKPKVTRQDVVLAKSSLFRFDEGRDLEARLQKVLSYDYEKSEYYGQVPGTIRALPATVRDVTGQVHSILWGLPEKSRQKETLMVGHALRHQTAVDVSVVGVRVTEEVPYRGTLVTIFPDGGRRERKIEGVLQRRYLNNIRPEYSRVYQIKDSIVVTANPADEEAEEQHRRRKKEEEQKRRKQHHGKGTSRPNSWSDGGQSSGKNLMLSDEEERRLASSAVIGQMDASAAATPVSAAATSALCACAVMLLLAKVF